MTSWVSESYFTWMISGSEERRNGAPTAGGAASGRSAEVGSARDTGAFTDEQLDAESKGYLQDFGPDHGQAMFEQEYYCSFEATVPGAIYAAELHRATEEGRITSVP